MSTIQLQPPLEPRFAYPDATPIAQPKPTKIHPFTLFALAFLFFSVVFEDANPGGIEPSTIAGLLFVFPLFLQPKIFFRGPRAPLIFFSVWVLVAISVSLLMPHDHTFYVYKRTFQWFYLLLLGWLLSNLLRERKAMDIAFFSMAGANLLLAGLQVTGIAARPWGVGIGERITAFGFHPNQLAFTLSLGVVALMALSAFPHTRRYLPMWLLLPCVGIIALAMVQTGSRGGLLSLGFGIVAFCFQAGTMKQRANALFMVFAGMLLTVLLVTQSESTMERIDATVTEGHVSARDAVYPIALELFYERPLFGWGAADNTYELGNRYQEPEAPTKDTHNAFLYVATATGIAGLIPFIIGLVLSFRSAWHARRSELGVAPFAMIFCVFISALGVTLIQAKIFWLVLAIAVAAQTYVVGRGGKQA